MNKDFALHIEWAMQHERTAIDLCEHGLHSQAADRFHLASLCYEAAEMSTAAARMRGNMEAELRQVRPSPPVNISALVD